MEVMAGYKQTEVGVIPELWETRPLLTAVSIANGQVDPKKEPYSSMILVAPDHIESRTGKLIQKKSASEQHAISGKYLFNPGDIIYSKIRPYLRKVIHADFFGLCSADMYPLTAAQDVVPAFMHALLLDHRFSIFAETVSVRSGMPKINRDELAQFTFALPPIHEQRAISAALSDVDTLITGLDQLIAKKRDLKQAAMQQLLIGQRRLSGFSGEWETKRLGDVCRITTGKKDVNEGNPVGLYPFFTCSRSHTYSDSYSFDTEAILIAGNGDVGNLHFYNGKFEAYQRTYVISDFSSNVSYLWQQLSTYLADSLGIGKIGSSIPYIKKENLIGFQFESPKDEKEQSAIATVLSDMDAEIAALELHRDKTRDLKQGMMQELLTGRIRLV